MAEPGHWHGVCLTIAMTKRIARLFTIKTRFEAYLVTYAIAVGACERAKIYLATMPSWAGWFMALCCTAVVFVAGGKLLDSVRAEQEAAKAVAARGPRVPPRRLRQPMTPAALRRSVTAPSPTDSLPRRSNRGG